MTRTMDQLKTLKSLKKQNSIHLQYLVKKLNFQQQLYWFRKPGIMGNIHHSVVLQFSSGFIFSVCENQQN